MRSFFLTFLFALLALAQQPSFVPASFDVPREYRTSQFKLVPLGPDLAKQDYQAYMSSIAHLQKTFTGSDRWPTPNITMEDAVKDVEGEKSRFDARKSFTYSVLTLDGTKELGCVYLSPSPKQGYDAMVRIWVTQAEYDWGLENTLVPEVKTWLQTRWPFQKVAWPGREIPKEQWNALPKKN
jgi:hypothetical protein